ncbi:MAG TPA: hypothetical protein VEZ90_03540, partial [Blastocatellia bacterium]|nr:hypothetical protein [Blastocatellia bacterium]
SDRGGATNIYDPANSWTGADGALHLRIADRAGRATCAEVNLTRSLGYGTYRFVIRETSNLPPLAVLGMFTWDGVAAEQNHREMDIEISRWGDPANKNAQFVIQPFYVPANVERFKAPSGQLTCSFRWEPGRVSFNTVHGKESNRGSTPVAQHVFTSGVPSAGDELVHINLYVFGNNSSAGNESEVVIESFEFLP